MAYYLDKCNFYGLIKAENISKLTESFTNVFGLIANENGDIDDIDVDSMKLNFENEIAENAHLFEPGSYFDMVGEEGDPFRWYIDPNADGGYIDIGGVVLFPKTDEDLKQIETQFAHLL